MKFSISRFSTSIKAPSSKAKFTGFDDLSNDKQYEIEIRTVKDLFKLMKENNCGITINHPYEEDGLYEIIVNDDDYCDEEEYYEDDE